MTDMFITKKEKLAIVLEAVMYVTLILLASYFTICGDVFIRMIPMLYFLGIFGRVMFNKPIATIILGATSIFTFGCLIDDAINWEILWLAVYSGIMIAFGEITGHILNILYENFRLRKFIKYYHKVVYIIVLIACTLIPLFLNNIVNSNMISYIIARKNIDKYVNDNYAYSEYYVKEVGYIPSYSGGMYEFSLVLDSAEVILNYNNKEIADINLNKRKENLNMVANAEINILLSKNKLMNLDVECRYDYSKIATVPDIIRMTIGNVEKSDVNDIIKFISVIKTWDKFNIIDRMDVSVDGANVSISEKDLKEKDITKEYIFKGMEQELLSSREDR